MATSAFRSTTRRTQVGPCADGGRRGSRSSNSGEPNSKYLSDSSSVSAPRYGDSSRPRASSRRHSIDSESDVDGSSSSKHYQRFHRRGSRDGAESDGSAYRSLRKSSSQNDFSKSRRGNLFSDKEASGDEMQVEERTIRAVHAQMKQLRNKHPAEEFDVIGLYDAVKAEVRQAISDLRQEIRQQSTTERRSSSPFEDALNMRREYAEQLEKLEDEEQRRMELANIAKDLPSKANKRAYRSRRYPSQRQAVSQSLDEEARKFFEEYASVSRLERTEYPPSEDTSEQSSVVSTELTEPDAAKVTPLGQESVASALAEKPDYKANDKFNEDLTGRKLNFVTASPSQCETQNESNSSASSSKSMRSRRRAPVNVDGVVMPWLEWETGSESSRTSTQRSTIIDQVASREEAASDGREFQWDFNFSEISTGESLLISSEVEDVLPERIRFVDRISSGRMHVCMSLF